MLLTDGTPNDTEALRVYESTILDVAHDESIELSIKLGLALEEVTEDVIDILLSRTSNDVDALARRMKGVSDVVVTPQLKRWHAVHTLEVFYRDTYNNQLNDRYQVKSLEYRELSRNARLHVLRYGIGLVNDPIPQADIPQITFGVGPQAEATYYIQVAWVSASGQEGAPSMLTAVDSVASTVPVIHPINAPANAVGFNVYVGLSEAQVGLQNSTPVPVGVPYQVGDAGPVPGRPPGNGQAPEVYITGGTSLIRG